MSTTAPPRLGPRTERRIRRTAIGFVIFVALAAAVLSFSGLYTLALGAGITPTIAALLPLITDFGVAAFSLQIVHHEMVGLRTAFPWLCMLLSVAVSIAGNVWSAPDLLVARLVHAWPPIVFALSFEALTRLLRQRIHNAAVTAEATQPAQAASAEATVVPVPAKARPAVTSQPATPTPTAAAWQPRLVPAPSATVSTSGSETRPPLRDRLIELLQEEPEITQAAAARRLEVDRSNLGKVWRQLRAEQPDLFDPAIPPLQGSLV